ncbi:unannotated protein [freshwater metagenome]|uniref:Unannotated protein n=1 Tax=freshwater metagenome TaxID=449393 RepID=A0A6J6Z034_9ZZZZ
MCSKVVIGADVELKGRQQFHGVVIEFGNAAAWVHPNDAPTIGICRTNCGTKTTRTDWGVTQSIGNRAGRTYWPNDANGVLLGGIIVGHCAFAVGKKIIPWGKLHALRCHEPTLRLCISYCNSVPNKTKGQSFGKPAPEAPFPRTVASPVSDHNEDEDRREQQHA